MHSRFNPLAAGKRAAALGLLAFLLAGPSAAQVGMREQTIGAYAVTLVYPTPARASVQRLGPFEIEVALQAPPLDKRQRLIVMSHGTGGSAVADHALAARFARAGFVVAQPLHRGDNYQDMSLAGPESFKRRPDEVSQVIDGLARDPLWGPKLDLGKVGVHGMSAGGVTVLALAGAQWRMLDLIRHCNQHDTEDESFCFQGAKKPDQRAERKANYDRAKSVPDLFLPSDLKTWHGGRTPTGDSADPRPDSRVAVVSLAVPLAVIFSSDSLKRINIPIGIVGAQRDEVLVPRFHSKHILKHCKTCSLLADLPGAGHFDLLWPWPETVARATADAQVRGGDPVPGFNPALREAAQAKLVAFHVQHLLP
jgi:predicted dienelactone hydrolase